MLIYVVSSLTQAFSRQSYLVASIGDHANIIMSSPDRCLIMCPAQGLTQLKLLWLGGLWLILVLTLFPCLVYGKWPQNVACARLNLLAMSAGIWFIIPHNVEVPVDITGFTLTDTAVKRHCLYAYRPLLTPRSSAHYFPHQKHPTQL